MLEQKRYSGWVILPGTRVKRPKRSMEYGSDIPAFDGTVLSQNGALVYVLVGSRVIRAEFHTLEVVSEDPLSCFGPPKAQ